MSTSLGFPRTVFQTGGGMELSGTMSECSHTIKLLGPGPSNFKMHLSEQGLMINNENIESGV